MTLVEMLVAMTLTLVMMGAVAQIFGMFGRGVNGSRSVTGLYERMRAAAYRLREDLSGITVDTAATPPVSAARNNGYFEYIEGPESDRFTYFGATPFDKAGGSIDTNGVWQAEREPYESETGSDDRLVGDIDDVLLFTTRSGGELFAGRVGTRNNNAAGGSVRSPYAEVIWFCRPTSNTSSPRTYTLYRRQRLVMAHPGAEPFVNTSTTGVSTNVVGGPPNTMPFTNWKDLYRQTDVSCRRQGGIAVPNCLGDLTRRENRFLHGDVFPYVFPHPIYAYDADNHTFDTNPDRSGEDVILTNVLAFDVRIWDAQAVVQAVESKVVTGVSSGNSRLAVQPGDMGYIMPGSAGFPAAGAPGYGSQGAFVDLAWGGLYSSANPASNWVGVPPNRIQVGQLFPPVGSTPFQGQGSFVSNSNRKALPFPTYDTWSDYYEANGIDDDGDGDIDNSNSGVPETSAPYPIPLQPSGGGGGLEVRLRCYDPSSRQVRQITIRHSLQ